MITFCLALLVLVAGYFVYGKLLDKHLFQPNATAITPAIAQRDGVDYLPLATWKIFMIQFLNIAGLGPIFGAIMGAQFGTASYLWIVLGTLFAGAMHDFFSGAISIRSRGATLPEIVGQQLGRPTRNIMGIFTIFLMILVGVVFVSGPAELLDQNTPPALGYQFWIVVIFLYYLLATLLPVDKIIGKVYPLFAMALLFMAAGILFVLLVKRPALPELWDGFGTKYESAPIFPMMFISIACGAISGFHATQSPLMARCITNEKHCRPIFYGAMVTEGIVALIWAAAATWFFHDHGIIDESTGQAYSGAKVASQISREWLGSIGGLLAILGIIAAPITSGDTALRSARLMIADFLKLDQQKLSRRLLITLPLFLVTIALLLWSFSNAEGFKIIWRYFAWSNQTLSVFTLWTIAVWLVREKKAPWCAFVPAVFMTCTCTTYLLIAPEGLHLPPLPAYIGGLLASLVAGYWFIRWQRAHRQ